MAHDREQETGSSPGCLIIEFGCLLVAVKIACADAFVKYSAEAVYLYTIFDKIARSFWVLGADSVQEQSQEKVKPLKMLLKKHT